MGSSEEKKPLVETIGKEIVGAKSKSAVIIAQNDGLLFTPLKGKRPYINGWQDNPEPFEGVIIKVVNDSATGIGLVHAHSGTCSLDIDNYDKAKEMLADEGIDLDSQLDSSNNFRIHSPKQNSEKLIFKLEQSLPTIQIKDQNDGMIFELRCNGSQDAWVGSAYQFDDGSFDGEYTHSGSEVISPLPKELVALWLKKIVERPKFTAATGDDVVCEDDATLEQAIRYLNRINPAIQGQGGDTHTYNTILYLRDLGLNDGTSFSLMAEHFNSRCIPPWSQRELEGKVRSAYKHAKNAQGCLSARDAFEKAGLGNPNKSEFNNVIENQSLVSELETWPDGTTERGTPLPTTPNFEFMIRRASVRLALNDMSHEIEVVGIRLQSDSVENDAINWVEDEAIRNRMPFSRIKSSISTIAAKNRYHPFDRYLDTLPEWDSGDRIGEFVSTLKTKDSSADYYNTSHMMITRWFISIVAAVRRPQGSNPLRIVLVLSGTQHIGKTTTYKKIMPDSSYFKDGGHLDPADKDSVIQNTQHLVVELGEIDTTFARKDVSRLKAFIGKDIDLIRLPYDKGVSKYVRRTVYCGTVNDSSFLTDQTGNSRFAVIDLVSIDWDKLNQINIKQLWSQILHLFNTGEPWNFTQDELTLVNNRNTQHTETPYIETLVKEKFNWNTDKGAWQWLTITEIVDQVHLQDVVVRNSRSRKEFISALTHQTESKMDSKLRTTVYLVPLSTAFGELALRSHSLRGA